MAEDYSVGSLFLGIEGRETGAIKSIDKVINRLNSLQTAISALDGSKITTFAQSLGSFSAVFNKETSDNISKFTRRIGSLGKKLASTDFSAFEKGFGNLTTAITPFVNKIKEAQDGLISLERIITKTTGKKVQSLLDYGSGKQNKRNDASGLFKIGKLTATVYAARRVARVLGRIVQYGVDYTETLNLWQVAMRDNLSLADEFVKKMNKAYGISEKTVMSAQATFRNMIGSLGDLSSETSYILSESITQMALDYASLYNTSIEEAINKFQSALAGQVRPIRSISGYDITEKTIHALYQSLGGTKTQRQLSRTEKQLLAIYAIFNQMGASGALGDMTKTIGNFANQSRMLRENWAELATWIGTGTTYLLEQWGIMVKLNALLITIKEIIKSVVYASGYERPNFATAWASDVEATNKGIDELQGKLLDFDKFRSLSSNEENVLQIDQALLKAMQGYSSVIDESANKSQQIANSWLETLGFVDKNNDGIYDITQKAEDFLKVMKSIGIVVGAIISYNLVSKITKLIKWITGLKTATAGLNTVLAAGAIYLLLQLADAAKKGEYGVVALYTAIIGGVGLIYAFKLLNKVSFVSLVRLEMALNTIQATHLAIGAIVVGISLFVSSLDKLSHTAKVLIPVLSALAGVVAALAIAKAGMSFRAAITAGAITAGIGLVVGTLASVKKYKDGGIPDKGTLFYAGEAGAEMVYSTPSGQSGVANIQQIAQADYSGTRQALNDWWASARKDIPAFREVSKTGIYEVVDSEAKRRGKTIPNR